MKSNKKHKNAYIAAAVLAILAVLAAAAFILWRRLCFISYVPEKYTESSDALSNPYIGWYTLHGYILSDTESLTLPDTSSADTGSAGLVLLEINLKNYTGCDLSDTALSQLDTLLSAWSAMGNQLIVRFVYDWDGQNLMTEPQDLSQILTHMTQCSKVIRRYTPEVYIIQGIFVGNWGEMHNTKHMSDGGMSTLLNHLAEVTDPSVFLAVRTPAQLRTILNSAKTLDASEAFSGTLAARLGLFNDGMLGSLTDTGTYAETAENDTVLSLPHSRAAELEFQDTLCRFVPNGGEVINDNPQNDLTAAIDTLSKMHVSYLNSGYDTAVLNKWKNTAYTGSDTSFNGLSGYDYIGRHLGYRYVVTASSLERTGFWGSNATLSLTLKNTGFSAAYRPFDLEIHIVSESGEDTAIPLYWDIRTLSSGMSETLQIPLKINDIALGRCSLYLKITDPASGREIQLANDLSRTAFGYKFASADISRLSD